MGTDMVPSASRTPRAPKIRIIASGIFSVQITPNIRTHTIAMISIVDHWHNEMRIFTGVGINNNKAWLVAKAVAPTDARVFQNASLFSIFPLHITNRTIVNNARDEGMPSHVRYV